MKQLNEKLVELQAWAAEVLPAMSLRQDVPMCRYTTLHLGGPADLLAEPQNKEELSDLLRQAQRLDLPVTVFGRGSNLLVLDGGIRGLVIHTTGAMRMISVEGCMLRAQAGASMSAVSRAAAENDLVGLAFASGIPGSIGGGVIMNAGAYDGEIGPHVALVEGVDLSGEPFVLAPDSLHFSYRHSDFTHGNRIVTDVTLCLQPGDGQAELAKADAFNRRRADKQPLTEASAGSTFKRPVGGYASALIDGCGLRGFAVGGASVSEKHAGFLINRGDSSADFVALMQAVQQRVEAETGIRLEPEVRIVGEPAAEGGRA